MKNFPSRLNVKYKNRFPEYLYDRTIAYLRRDLCELILRCNEEKYFSLDEWFRSQNYTDKTGQKQMVDAVMEELRQLGWTCNTSFGGTGLFVYSNSDEPPKNYFPDGF